MSRTLVRPIVAVPVCGLVFGWCAPAPAQQPAPAQPSAQPAAPRQPRPEGGADLQVEEIPPRLNQLLTMWAQESAKIRKLEGQHRRIVYDNVFAVAKQAEGWFYYEAPDRGRIDLKPVKVPAGTPPLVKDGKQFEVQSDKPERWICNGTEVRQINDADKQVDIFPIPAQAQGQNIMDGPLPFLFGMPPEKMKLRYKMTFLGEKGQYAYIDVEPRWQQDASNWQKARLILDTVSWLPHAVKLIDPTGNTETVYTFPPESLQKNKQRGFFEDLFGVGEKNPFEPNLAGYKPNIVAPQTAAATPPRGTPAQPPVLPALANIPYGQAKMLLERAGCQVALKAGQAAPKGELAHVVYQQTPAAGVPLQKGMTVELIVYLCGDQMPSLEGYHWKDVDALLKAAGRSVKYTPGAAAPTEAQLYTVYAQEPAPGTKLEAGKPVAVTLYNKPAAQAGGNAASAQR